MIALLLAAAAAAGTFSPPADRDLLRSVYEELVSIDTSYCTGQTSVLAALLAVAGQTAEARSGPARAEREPDACGPNTLWLARGYAAVGDADRAAALAERALAAGSDDPYFVLIDPSLASIRDRPEIDRLSPAGHDPRRADPKHAARAH